MHAVFSIEAVRHLLRSEYFEGRDKIFLKGEAAKFGVISKIFH